MIKLARLELRYDEHRTLTLPDTKQGIAEALYTWGLSRGPQEVGWVVSINGQGDIHTAIEIARGTSNRLPVHLPTLLSAVLTSGTDRFIFVHSHPTGSVEPSSADVFLTKQISDAAATCGLYFEDHMIVTHDPMKLCSLKQRGLYIPPKYIETEAAKYGT